MNASNYRALKDVEKKIANDFKCATMNEASMWVPFNVYLEITNYDRAVIWTTTF